jgi:hypothetical protein
MSQTPSNPSPDVLRLINEGYEVEIRGAHLLVSHVPYVNSARQVKFGTLVSTLALAGNEIIKPDTHVAHFIGEHPCHRDGAIMHQIQHGSQTHALAEGLVVNHSFSNKPPDGYPNYYEKMSRYVEVISAPAQSLDPTVTSLVVRPLHTMKRKRAKKEGQKPQWRFVVRFCRERHGWVIDGAPGRQVVFATKMDAENHCVQRLGQAPAVSGPTPLRHQELPESSVWTGAPWDRSFEHIN